MRGFGVLASVSFLAAPLEAPAQGVDCGRLQAQIAAVSRAASPQSTRYSAAASQQQAELNRTANYAASIGCNNRQFLFFGSSPPAQCGGLNARIAQLRASIASLNSQARASSNDGQRAALQARYDTWCRSAPATRSVFDSLFGRGNDLFDNRVQVPIEPQRKAPLAPREIEEEDFDRPRGGSIAVCVRTCDGGFFPVSYSARRSNLDDLEDMCKALCPNAEVRLYTHRSGGDIDSATSIDGESYTSLRNAGKYRTKFDPTCGCKPPNKSWADALSDAEDMLGKKRSTDIIVTPEKSEELLRGGPATAKKPAPPAVATAKPANGPSAPPRAPNSADALRVGQDPAVDQRKPVRVIDPNL